MNHFTNSELSLAQLAYVGYGESTNFKNYLGNPMPEWVALPEKIQVAWVRAAAAIRHNVSSIPAASFHKYREAVAIYGYKAYGESVDFKNFQGFLMPQWGDLTVSVRNAWFAAVDAIHYYCLETSQNG